MFETLSETLGLDTSPVRASLWLALGIGIAFGVMAEITRFCLRRAVVPGADRRAAAGTWLTALAVAVIGTQAAIAAGWIGFEEHRFWAADLPVLAIALGGLAFGVGMVLTRGCASRLAVLSGSGNLRAILVLLVFAITAHATMKGIFAPIRTTLAQFTLPLGDVTSLAALPGGAVLWAGLIAAAALAFGLRSGNRPGHLALAALIGILVPLGWVGTGYLLLDEFDPITMESLSLTAPAAETLFYTAASTAVDPGFGPGLFGGIVIGAAISALIAGRFQWQSFETPAQTGRYLLGGALMGMGGVLAGGLHPRGRAVGPAHLRLCRYPCPWGDPRRRRLGRSDA